MNFHTLLGGRPDSAPRLLTEKKERARPRRHSRQLVFLVLLAISGGFALRPTLRRDSPANAIEATIPTVTVSQPLRRRMASWKDFLGQFSAVHRVEVKAQIGGYVTEIRFEDGQFVEKGDVLLVIDPRPYEIRLRQAKAQHQSALAQIELAKKQLARSSALRERDYISKETHDQRMQEMQAGEAAVEQAAASIQSAELNLEWTRIRAPISGRIGARRVSLGSLVGGGQSAGATTLLTTIVSLDPIYLDFDMSEADYLAYRRQLPRKTGEEQPAHSVEIALSDEEGWMRKGRLDFFDNELDRSSGVVHARATVPNADFFIAPGQFARLRVPTEPETDMLLVPESALSVDQSRMLVLTISEDDRVVPKDVEIGVALGDMRIVKRGIGPDDRVIINGSIFVRPGGKVAPRAGHLVDVVGRD